MAKPSIPMEYCASSNTANMVPLNNIWQSDGRCFNSCTDLRFALAIVQGKNCWCSNLVPNPADEKPLTDCQDPCPGYPDDHCGGKGVFGYMLVAGFTPTGTAPGPSATKPPSSSSVPSSSTVTSTTLSSSSSSASSSTTTTTTTTTSSSSKTSSSSARPIVETVTVGGTVRTVTATPDPEPTSTSTNDPAPVPTESKGLAAGAIAGIVIGVIGGLAILAAFLWLLFAKRRKRQRLDEADVASNGAGAPMRGGGGGGGGRGSGSPPGMAAATPKSTETAQSRYPLGQVPPGWDAAKRRSHLMPIDPRLDPFAKGIYADQNHSRESFNSLQDNHDYSRRVHEPTRVLRATNPDPDV
ncbi:hypothetical protein BT67DRAFT_496680 [Trichocladium antarcticum]|uniref:WSC domain-containing protein n=1 Tax=Trichocladium antarcticum TaxID=1450529 RepID=A0AAN6ZEN9_9PEZI|nr:hypothetical protein BT67DRAFT_496680 [Trichocladium antarcticum]